MILLERASQEELYSEELYMSVLIRCGDLYHACTFEWETSISTHNFSLECIFFSFIAPSSEELWALRKF